MAQGVGHLEIPCALRLEPLTFIHIILPLSEKKVIYLRFFLIRGVVENLTPFDTQLDDIWASIWDQSKPYFYIHCFTKENK